MEDHPVTRSSPRFPGIVEQYQRTGWLLRSAAKTADGGTRFRILVLAIYPARAITEIMLEAAEKGELEGLQDSDGKKNRQQFEQAYLSSLPHYLFIEKIRIHDFHRFGCVPGTPGVFQMNLGGPVKLTASNGGEACIAIPLYGDGAKEVLEIGNAKVKEQRTLIQRGDNFYDDVSNTYLRLDEILLPYLAAVEPVISKFQGLIKGTRIEAGVEQTVQDRAGISDAGAVWGHSGFFWP